MANFFKVNTLVLSKQFLSATGNNLYVNSLLVGSGTYPLFSDLQNTGQQAWVTANNNALNISGNLTQSGVSLQNLIFGGDSNLSGRLTQTGVSLYNLIVGSSGQANLNFATNANLAVTGQQAWNAAQNNALNLSGNLTLSGAAFFAQDAFSSGVLSTGIFLTGFTVDSKINALSGYSDSAYVSNILDQYVNGSKYFTSPVGILGSSGGNFAVQGLLSIFTNSTGSNSLPLIALRGDFATAVGNYGMIRFGDQSQTTAYQKGAIIYEGVAGSSRGRMHIALENTDTAGSVQLSDARLTVLSNGNVGIGQTNPSQPLHVGGIIRSDTGFFSGNTNLGDIFYSQLNPSGFITGISTGNFVSVTSLQSTGQQAWTAADSNSRNLSGNLALSGTAFLTQDARSSGILSTGIQLTGSNLYNLVTGLSGVTSLAASSFKNKIINGSMDIAQRGTSFLNLSGQTIYTLDQYCYSSTPSINTGVNVTGQMNIIWSGGFPQNTAVNFPPNQEFLNKLTMVVARPQNFMPTGGYSILTQPIEVGNMTNLIGKNMTLSFWVNASVTGYNCVSFSNYLNGNIDRSWVSEYVVNSPSTWEYKTLPVTGGLITGGTNWSLGGTFNQKAGLLVRFCLGAGASYQTTSGMWQAGNFLSTARQVNQLANPTGSQFSLVGLQLEIGNATPFERRPLQQELALCQRYYQFYAGLWITQTTFGNTVLPFPVPTALSFPTYSGDATINISVINNNLVTLNRATGASLNFAILSTLI